MAYGGTREYKLYTFKSGQITRSFKTETAVLAAYYALSVLDRRNTEVYRERNKQTPRDRIRRIGKDD